MEQNQFDTLVWNKKADGLNGEVILSWRFLPG